MGRTAPGVVNLELEGKRAIVTGGSLGIGAVIAHVMAEEGCDVAINYRRHDAEAKEVGKGIEALGRKCLVVKADVASFEDAQKMVDKVVEDLGGLDFLVCNAGINRDAVIWKMTEEQWDEVITTNLKGYFNYVRAAVPVLRAQKSGKIVLVTSINGLRGKFGQTNYSASKGGIIALTKALARELGRASINVNAVAPGMVETEMAANIPEEWLQKAVDETVLGRIAKPEEVANVITFLCSERSKTTCVLV
jgi:3-oxoacyl-[acyl-carrier protein] reductase